MSKKEFYFIVALALNLCLNFCLNLNIPTKVSAQTVYADFSYKLQPIREETLENGLDVIIQENHRQKLVALEIIVKTGSIFEGKHQGSGLAHLTEHMLFKGTPTHRAGTIEAEIKSLGGSINGYASHQFTGYTLVLPSQNFKAGLEIMGDMLMNPVFDPEQLEMEKQVILSEIRLNRDDPERYISNLFWKHAYAVAPYNLPVIGLEVLFNRLDRTDVLNFYREWYVPNNTIIAVSGDIDTEGVLEAVKHNLGAMPLQPYPVVSLPEIPPLKGTQNYEQAYEVSSARMILGFPSVVLTHPDSATLDIIATLLGQGESSRLYKKLLKERGLVSAINCYNYTPGFRGMFVFNCVFDIENKQEIINEIFQGIKVLKTKPLTDKELEKAKNTYLSDYIFSQITVADQAKNLATDKAYTGNAFFTQNYLESIAMITPADVQRCAKKYFSEADFISVTINPEKAQKEIMPQKQENNYPIKKVTLDNGLRILLKKDASVPIVSVNACFEGGTRRENDMNNGVFNLLSQLLLKGTRKMSGDEISAAFEFMGARVSAFSGYNSFGLNMNLLSKDISKGLEIFADMLLQPTFDENELNIQKQLAINNLELEHDDVFKDTYNILKQNMFENYAYRFNPLGTKQNIEAVNNKKLLDFYKQYVVANNLVLTVFGDFNEEIILKEIKKKFSKFKRSSKLAAPVFNEKLRKDTNIVSNARNKEQAIFMIGFPGCSLKNPDRYALEFLSSLLSSPGGMLYEKIREKQGLSYTLGGASVSGLDTGFIFIYVAAKAQSIDEIKEIILNKIRDIQQGNIDEGLFVSTKNYLIAMHRIALESIPALAFTVALNELYGLGIEEHLKFEQEINGIDEKAIQDAANKYLEPNNATIVITKDAF